MHVCNASTPAARRGETLHSTGAWSCRDRAGVVHKLRKHFACDTICGIAYWWSVSIKISKPSGAWIYAFKLLNPRELCMKWSGGEEGKAEEVEERNWEGNIKTTF